MVKKKGVISLVSHIIKNIEFDYLNSQRRYFLTQQAEQVSKYL